jgi:hypothetical protein
MEKEVRVVGDFYQGDDGKWYITPESKAASLAMYYSGRLAYDKTDPRKVVGTYSPTGEVIPYQTWATKASDNSTQE